METRPYATKGSTPRTRPPDTPERPPPVLLHEGGEEGGTDQARPLKAQKWAVELGGGMLAGLISCVAFYPLESVEARMQVGQLLGAQRSLPRLVALVGRSEGARGLYRGVVPTATGTMLNWGLYFLIYDHARTRLARPPRGTSVADEVRDDHGPSSPRPTAQGKHRPAIGRDMVAAAVSGAICTFVVNPFWVLKLQRITAPSSSPAPSLLTSVRQVASSSGGYRGFWRGSLISLMGVVDGALQLASYEQMKHHLSDERGVLPAWGQLLAGGCSRVVALLATYPYQLLRSVLQQQHCPYRGIQDAFRQIVGREGVRGLYKGVGLNLTRSVPPAACMFLILEQFRLLMT